MTSFFHFGNFASQAELAHHLGVSKVWVSRVLKAIKNNPG
jgi:biotin operon repressor